jgi:arabinogalactan endo-1,4-beta-galactosidase
LKTLFSLVFILMLTVSVAGCRPVPAPATQPPEAQATASPTSAPTPGAAVLVNPGFEEKDENGGPAGWTSTGAVSAVLLEDKGHSGAYRLTQLAAKTYQVDTSQVVSGLANDWYSLSGWFRSSGKQVQVYLALKCGESEKRVYVPSTSPGYRWIRLTVSNQVTGGQCTIHIHSFGTANSWVSLDDVELVPGRAALSILGADISSLHKSEDKGGVYKTSAGAPADALQILHDNGMNYARLRIWVDPADGYHNKAEILLMAKRLKAAGIKLLVDFHYSDEWADPGKQVKPAAWANDTFEQLKQHVYDFTFDVCSSLAAQGTPADMVQVGNEINAGILWPDGDYNHLDNLAALLKAGQQAVKAASSSTLVMLHVAEGGNNTMNRWFFDAMTNRKVPFDVIGVSYYPFWHGTLAELQGNLNDLSATYDKDVIVAEFAYAFTRLEGDSQVNILTWKMATEGYLFTPEGQRLMLRDVMSVIRGVPNGRGLGIFYWDATWTVVPGNGWDTKDPNSGDSWENQALFDNNDEALPALAEYINP